MKNRTNFRGFGIDVRSNGGYIVAPGLTINGRSYTIIKDLPIINIPTNLLNWLIVGATKESEPPTQRETENKPQGITATSHYEYCMTDDAVVKILNKLPNNFLDKYSDWIKVLSVMKKHNKLEIWNKWCKKSNKYNYERNMRFWNYNKGVLDINYLIWELNKQGHDMEYIRRYKPYIPLTRNISGMKKITFNQPFVYDRSNKTNTYNYHHVEDHSTSIIKSCTGTGKPQQ